MIITMNFADTGGMHRTYGTWERRDLDGEGKDMYRSKFGKVGLRVMTAQKGSITL